jgi:biopolymer transport protein ExbD
MASKKNIPEINASSQADIAFTVLIFFLVVSTMDVDTGLMRTLPPMPDDQVKNLEDIKIKERNILKVLVSRNGNIMVGLGDEPYREIALDNLKKEAKDFVLNSENSEKLPEKKNTDFDLPTRSPKYGSRLTYPVSMGVISLQCEKSTLYEPYLQVQNELTIAFNEIRDRLSNDVWGRSFKELSAKESEVITKAIPVKISEAEPREDSKK